MRKSFQPTYSDYLHNKLMQINSHNVSCLHKPALEDHATQGLRDCDEEFSSYFCYSDQEPEARYMDYKSECRRPNSPESAYRTWDTETLQSELGDLGVMYHKGILPQSVLHEHCWDDTSTENGGMSQELADFYARMRLYPEERFPNNSVCGWRNCHSGHLGDLDPQLLTFHLDDDLFSESTRRMLNKRQETLRQAASRERMPFGLSPFTITPPDSRGGKGESVEKNANNQNTAIKVTENRKSRVKSSSSSKSTRSQVRSTKPQVERPVCYHMQQQQLKASVQTLSDTPINYRFKHGPEYRKHFIDSYRDQYTAKKLEHVLLQCAQRYYASRQQQPLSRAAVQCTDVREGACLVNEGAAAVQGRDGSSSLFHRPKGARGSKTLGLARKKSGQIKVSQYQFDMCQKILAQSMKPKQKPESRRPKSSSDCSPRATPARSKQTSPVNLSLTGVQSLKNVMNETYSSKPSEDDAVNSATALPDRPAPANVEPADEKPSSAEQNKMPYNPLLRNASPSVNRSRPSIPSNSRGVVCATSIETPLHIVTGTKPLCRGTKKWVGGSPKSAMVSVKDTKPTAGAEEPGQERQQVMSGEELLTATDPTSSDPAIGPSSGHAHFDLSPAHPASSEPSIKALKKVNLAKPKVPAKVKCSNCALRSRNMQETDNVQIILRNRQAKASPSKK